MNGTLTVNGKFVDKCYVSGKISGKMIDLLMNLL